MRRTLVYGVATATLALTLGTCTAPNSPVETLYGPPSREAEDADEGPAAAPSEKTDEDDPVEDLYGAPVIAETDDSESVPVLYGVPTDIATDDADAS